MSLPLRLQPNGPVSLQTQIFEQVRAMILEGRLRPGEPLPSTRTLSEQLGMSRNTAAFAYERLEAEGYLESRQSVGTFVSHNIPETALYAATQTSASVQERAVRRAAKCRLMTTPLRSQVLVNPCRRKLVADFWVGRPDPNSFPRKVWSRLIVRCLSRAGAALTEYRDPAGLLELREAIADRLRPARSIVVSAEQIIVVGGCQDGLNLVSRMIVEPGSAAVVESPCYQGAAFLFETLGARLVPVRVDEQGIDCRRLPDVTNAIAYITPSHQYPLGVTLTLERRLELLAWANRTNSYVLEDDYDSDFRFQGAPVAALKGLDQAGRVIYLGTFSKSLGPGLRLGYVVFPQHLVDHARHFKTLMSNGQPWLEQAALAELMQSGAYERHVRRIRQLYYSRRNALLASLSRHFPGGEVIGDEAGMHLAWRIPRNLPSASAIERIGLDAGVGVYTLASGAAFNFGATGDSDRYLVFGFSSLTEAQIATGIGRLAEALGHRGRVRSATGAAGRP